MSTDKIQKGKVEFSEHPNGYSNYPSQLFLISGNMQRRIQSGIRNTDGLLAHRRASSPQTGYYPAHRRATSFEVEKGHF